MSPRTIHSVKSDSAKPDSAKPDSAKSDSAKSQPSASNHPSASTQPWWHWKRLRFGVPLLMMVLGAGDFGLKLLSSVAMDQSQASVMTESVERKTVPVTITANGTVQAERSIDLSSKSAGMIRSLSVKEGDRVRQGQVLANMDNTNLQGQWQQAQGQLAQQEANLQRLSAGNRQEDIAKAEAQLAEAEANLQQLRAGNRPQEIAQAEARWQQAQATLRQREEDWQRHQSLYDQGAISRQTLDQKRADREVAQAQVMEAQQALSLQTSGARPEQLAQAEARVEQQRQTVAALRAGNRPEDIAQARAQVQAAQGALQTIEAQLQDTQIVAPFDGIIMHIAADVGAYVSPSMSGGTSEATGAILTLASLDQQVVVNLSESQIARVKVGQMVNIEADAFPGSVFRGKVAEIAPQATLSQNVTSFEVRVAITSANAAQLRVGMNVEAQFEIDQLENALLVPNAAVVRQAEGTGVYVLDDDRRPVFRPIEPGMTAGAQTEVKSGLAGDEQVLVSPPAEPERGSGFGFPPAP